MRHFLILLILAIPASAQSRINCSALNSHILGQLVHYCVLLPSGYDSDTAKSTRYPVLYFLHGLGENEQTLVKSGGWNLVEDLRQQHKIGDFLIVTPEGKASFYVNSADGKVLYSDFFLHEFMPYLETKFRIASGSRSRAITGISMGGYGALRFAFAYPELFSSVSAQSAALMTASPQDLATAVWSGTQLGRLLGAVFGNPFSVAHWKESDPFLIAKKNRRAIRKLAIYFNCGRDDDFRFEIGAEALHGQLNAEDIKHEYHLYPGDHSASYFLTHLGEVMQFHSTQFEKGQRRN